MAVGCDTFLHLPEGGVTDQDLHFSSGGLQMLKLPTLGKLPEVVQARKRRRVKDKQVRTEKKKKLIGRK